MKKRAILAALLSLLLMLCAQSLGEGESPAMLRNGGSFVFVVKENGQIIGWGDNRTGQLGSRNTRRLYSPAAVAEGIDGNKLADIQCGNENTLFLMDDGTVYTCGTHYHGAQGLGKPSRSVITPTRIPELENIVQVSCGFGHNAALDRDGHVWVWGRNDHGQLGLGDKTERYSPAMIELEGITAISCGGKFMIAQDGQGRFWGWGYNEYRVLADDDRKNILSPELLQGFEELKIVSFSGGSDCAFWLDDEGTLWSRGRNDFRQLGSSETKGKKSGRMVRVDIPEKVASVVAYSSAVIALTENGNVYVWGNLTAGQSGIGKATSMLPTLSWDQGNAVEVANGSLILSFRTTDGKIYVTGFNKHGQLGNGSQTSTSHWSHNGVNVNDP